MKYYGSGVSATKSCTQVKALNDMPKKLYRNINFYRVRVNWTIYRGSKGRMRTDAHGRVDVPIYLYFM